MKSFQREVSNERVRYINELPKQLLFCEPITENLDEISLRLVGQSQKSFECSGMLANLYRVESITSSWEN